MSATWLTLGEMIRVNAAKYPRRVALSDETRSFTFPETDRRTRKLGNALLALGLRPGDRVAMFLENCPEICEVYWACAKAGLVAVPINFRCVGPEIEYIMNHAEAKVLVVHDEFAPLINPVRAGFRNVVGEGLFVVGGTRPGWRGYEEFLAGGEDREPSVRVRPGRPLDPALHLRHDRQAQGRRALARVVRGLLPDQRHQLPLPPGRGLPDGDAVLPRQRHVLLLRRDLRRRTQPRLPRPLLRPGQAARRVRPPPRDLLLAGPHALQPDPQPARGAAREARRVVRAQAALLLRPRPLGDQEGHPARLPRRAALRRLRLDGSRHRHHAVPGRAAQQARVNRAGSAART